MGYSQGDKPITITKLLAMHAEGEKISMLTAYDSTMSALLNRCGVETILIGDSLGNVIQGHTSTYPSDSRAGCLPHRMCSARQ
jgi:3-methyl-2-oxobutanoate hydroxymethyltransferase